MCGFRRIDVTVGLRQPQPYAMLFEQGQQRDHLVATKRAFVLTDDNGVEAPIRIDQPIQARL